jgi:hypothetical protein
MGRPQTQETKDKISKANKGRVYTEERREGAKLRMIEYWKNDEYRENQRKKHLGRKSPCGMKGKKHSEKSRIKMSASQSGENNANWKGGITSKYLQERKGIENTLWREAVFSRDNYTCQACGDNKGKNLNAHHIRNFLDYEDLRTTISNGVTLCKKCHIKFHKIYGLTKTNEHQLQEFIDSVC